MDVLLEDLNRSMFLSFGFKGAFFDDFKFSKRKLYEKYGAKSDIDDYWNVFINDYYYHRTEPFYKLTTNIFKKIPGCFFNSVDIGVTREDVGYETHVCDTQLSTNGKMESFTVIFVLKDYDTYTDLLNKLKEIFYHEFTHFYEDYNRLRKQKPSIHDVTGDGTSYKKFTTFDVKDSEWKVKIKKILYHLDKIETNAFVSALHLDLKNSFEKEIKNLYCDNNNVKRIDVEKCIDCIIENDKTYKRFKIVRSYIDYLKSMPYMSYYIEEYWKNVTNKNMSYNKIIKKLEWLYNTRWRKYRIFISNIANEIHEKYAKRIIY